MDHLPDHPTQLPIILGSASPRRRELLSSMGVPFRAVLSQVEEAHDERLGAVQLCLSNARRKAEEISARFPEALVVGADTLVTRGDRIFGKPRDSEQAAQMLSELAGKTHQVITGVCLIAAASQRREEFHDVTEVTFKPLSAETIQDYIAKVWVLDKAGAYAIQEHGEMLIEQVSGSFSNVVGLPLEKLAEVLRRWGYSIRSR